MTDSISYLYPGEEVNYKLPTVFYVLLYAQLIEDQNVTCDPFSRPTILIPEIEVNIEYSDAQGNIHCQKAYIRTEAGEIYVNQGMFTIGVSIIPEDQLSSENNGKKDYKVQIDYIEAPEP